MSPRSSIGCVQNDFKACGTFGANCVLILHQHFHYIQIDQSEHPLEPHHIGGPSGASKRISEPIVHLAQTVHLSCTDTINVTKWTEIRFHMSHVTKEFH
jgi:hypothetical protein